MMTQAETNISPVRKFAVGYFYQEGTYNANVRFLPVVRKYYPYLCEVFFAWPGLASARRSDKASEYQKKRELLVHDLMECKANGLKLDLLANATCYGDDAVTENQRKSFYAELETLGKLGLEPDIFTTTSPYLAQIIRNVYPNVERRASVNMKLNSTLGMSYVADYFESYYICRDLQRDIPTLDMFSQWCNAHGKKLCMLVNSTCFRYCPWQTYHETMNDHDYAHTLQESRDIQYYPALCLNTLANGNYEELLRASWIRPEDLHKYEPYVSVMKLATRTASHPEYVLQAYTQGVWHGNLLDIVDPSIRSFLGGKIINNDKFPKEWSEGKVAGKCAINCTHCGKCTSVLNAVLESPASNRTTYSFH